MSFCAVAAARAQEAVVRIKVHSAFAQRASEVVLEDGCSKPSLHHGFEENGLDVAVCPFRRNSVQPLAGSLYAGERKVCEVAWVVARSLLELLEAVGVDSCGKLSLRGWACLWPRLLWCLFKSSSACDADSDGRNVV